MGLRRMGASHLCAAVIALVCAASAGAAPAATAARVGAAPANAELQIVLPLQADLAGLHRAATAITTPGSSQYGAYETIEQLARQYGASGRTRRRVSGYLTRAGARDVQIDPTGLFASAALTASNAARLFGTPLAQFRADGVRFIAPAAEVRASAAAVRAVRVPAPLRGLVTGVVGLDNRPLSARPPVGVAGRGRWARIASQPTSARARSGTPSGCAQGLATGGFTPNQYLTAYGYDGLRAAGLSGQGERVALIEVDGYKYSDLATFATCFHLPIPALTTYGVGIAKLLKPGGEATLDLEILDAAAPGLAAIDVFETKPNAAETLRALTAPLRARNKPSVISASLGLCEPALSRFIGDNGIFSTEGALEMASASGVTFVASTGDQGSADCTTGDGTPARQLSVNYPASSWWVTGVGGTNLELTAGNAISQELVWNDAAAQPGSAGGGGTSDLFKRPNYQRGSTKANGRAVPDVSLLSDIAPGYAIYCSAEDVNCLNDVNHSAWEALGGTSAATPLLAGGFAVINQLLRAAHKQPLGLANPMLYALSRSHARGVFRDITRYGNDIGPFFGSRRALGCCTARVGYDKASGIGSINLGALAGAVAARQPAVVSVGASLPGGQHPLRQRAIRVTVTCSGPCRTGAYALVAIGRARPFEVNSSVLRLAAAGSRTISLRFTTRELGRLRSALKHHTGVSATVRGVLFDSTVYAVLGDPAGSISQRTDPLTLKISS